MIQTAVLVDDEALARNELAFLLQRDHRGTIEVVGEADSGPRAVDLVRNLHPDIVFMDIRMPGMTGMEVLSQIQQPSAEYSPQVVFTTAFDEYACEAFDVDAADYLMKPIAAERLARTVARLKRNDLAVAATPAVRDVISVRRDQRIFLKSLEDVFFAEIQEGLVTVVDSEGIFSSSYRTLEDLAAHAGERFFRAHRGFLVNLRHVREIVPCAGGLFTLTIKPVSAGHAPALWAQSRAALDDHGQFQLPVSRVQARKLRRILNF